MADAQNPQLYVDPKQNWAGVEQEDRQEYQKALEAQLTALEQRYQNPNWFRVAAGFLKPQLGGVSAALGSASEALGESIEAGRAAMLPVASMRAQLAASKITMGQNQKVADMVAAHQASGQPLTPEFVAKVTALAPDAPSAKALAAQLATQQKEQELANAAQANRIREQDYYLRRAEAARVGINLPPMPSTTAGGATVSPPAGGSQRLDTVMGQPYQFAPPSPQDQGALPPNTGEVKAPQMPSPVQGARISSGYGERVSPITGKTEHHNGIDFAAPEGSPVTSVMPGKVTFAGDAGDGYGNKVEVTHPDGSKSYYAHLNDLSVQPGNEIESGASIGTVGKTGKATGPHVEFGVRDKDGKPVDPTSMFQPSAEAVPPKPRKYLASSASPFNILYTPADTSGLRKKTDEQINDIASARYAAMERSSNSKTFAENQNALNLMINTIAANSKLAKDVTDPLSKAGGGFLGGVLAGAEKGFTFNVAGLAGNLAAPVSETIIGSYDSKTQRPFYQLLNQQASQIAKIQQDLNSVNPNSVRAGEIDLYKQISANPKYQGPNVLLYNLQYTKLNNEMIHEMYEKANSILKGQDEYAVHPNSRTPLSDILTSNAMAEIANSYKPRFEKLNDQFMQAIGAKNK